MLSKINKEEKLLALAVAFLLVAQFSLVGLEKQWRVSEAHGGVEGEVDFGSANPVWCEEVDGGQECFDWSRLI